MCYVHSLTSSTASNNSNDDNSKKTTSRQFVTEIMDTVEIVNLAIDDFTVCTTCEEGECRRV